MTCPFGGTLFSWCLRLRKSSPCSPVEEWCRRMSSLRVSEERHKTGRSFDEPAAGEKLWGRFLSDNFQGWERGSSQGSPRDVDFLHVSGNDSSSLASWHPPFSKAKAAGPRITSCEASSESRPWSKQWDTLCDQGLLDEAFQVLDSLSQRGGLIPKQMLYRLLKGSVATKHLALGKDVHALAVRSGYESDAFIGNHLIRMYASHGFLAEANNVFSKLSVPNSYVWTSLISAYAENCHASEAIALYQKMQHAMVKRDDYVFVAALKACISAKDLATGKMVHADIMESGFLANLFVGSTLVDMYAKCGSLHDARRVFDALTNKNVVTWNAMIAGCAQHGIGHESLQLYERMQQEGTKPDAVTIVSVLKACGSMGAVQTGKQIHAQVLEQGLDADTFVGSSLVDMYVRCGSLGDAHTTFDKLPTKNVVTWNALISGYVSHGFDNKALDLYARMKHEGVLADNTTLVSILKACSRIGDAGAGKWIRSEMLTMGLKADVFLGSALVDMYIKLGSLDDAQGIFNVLSRRDAVTWNAMIAGYTQHGRGQDALNLYARMRQEGVTPHNLTYVSALKACASTGATQVGQGIHAEILDSGLEIDGFIGSALVDMYAKCGSLEDARMVFDRLPLRDVVTWTALINGYGQHNDSGMALQCFEEMLQQGVEPDAAIFLSLLVACSHVGLVNEGERYFKMMVERYGLTPGVEHYNCMVDLLGRSGCLDAAYTLVQSLPVQDCSVGWTSLLHACKTHGNVELGRRCFDRLTEMDSQQSAAYVLMSNIYADAGRWKDVSDIERLRQSAGAAKKFATATIQFNGKMHEFMVGENRNDTSAKLRSLNLQTLQERYAPQMELLSDKEKEDALCGHAEKLALAFGLLNTPDGTPLLIVKDLRMCNHCHNGTKIISRMENREIIVRDAHRVHHFKDGSCSCGEHA